MYAQLYAIWFSLVPKIKFQPFFVTMSHLLSLNHAKHLKFLMSHWRIKPFVFKWNDSIANFVWIWKIYFDEGPRYLIYNLPFYGEKNFKGYNIFKWSILEEKRKNVNKITKLCATLMIQYTHIIPHISH